MVRGSAPTWSTPRAAPGTYEPRHVNLEGREICFHFPQSSAGEVVQTERGNALGPQRNPEKEARKLEQKNAKKDV